MTLDLSILNPPQREAVETLRGPLLVLAGAGTGKTRVITYRMAHLMSKGVPPSQIMAMTFTNKAAKEMKERVNELVLRYRVADSETFKKNCFAGTFHSLCVRLLRNDIEKLGYGRNFAITDESDQQGLLKKIIHRVGGGGKEKLDAGLASSLISLAKNRGVSVQTLTRDNMVWAVEKEYSKALRLLNAVDFDDLLVLGVQLLRDYEEVRASWRRKVRYLLVDEFQDTNQLQLQLVRLLASDEHDVCAVGDDDQSIYGWRGAESGNILNFAKHFPGAHTVKLEQNYRSTPEILNAANHVISTNKQRHGKKLWSASPTGEKIRLATAPNDLAEAAWVVNDMITLAQRQVRKWEDFAVLYRMNTQSRAIEQELRRARIPYKIVGGMSFYERREVRDVIAYLQVMFNPKDDIALLRIINTPPRGIGETTIELLLEKSRTERKTVWETALKLASTESNRSAQAVKKFTDLVSRYSQLFAQTNDWQEALKQLLQDIGFSEDLQKSCKEQQEFINRSENIHELGISLKQSQNKGETLRDFLDMMTLDREREEDKEKQNRGVTLMTLHGAKGLEFPFVYMVGVEEGLLPHERSKQEGTVDEERRLMYVGVTRAMSRLTLSYCLKRKKYGEDEVRMPSRFLQELPKEVIETLAIAETPPVDTTLAIDQLKQLKASLSKR